MKKKPKISLLGAAVCMSGHTNHSLFFSSPFLCYHPSPFFTLFVAASLLLKSLLHVLISYCQSEIQILEPNIFKIFSFSLLPSALGGQRDRCHVTYHVPLYAISFLFCFFFSKKKRNSHYNNPKVPSSLLALDIYTHSVSNN